MRFGVKDVLIGVTNGPAWTSDLVNGDHYTGPSASQLPAVAGYPHLTVPMGAVQGLPIGISFIGPKWSDADVLAGTVSPGFFAGKLVLVGARATGLNDTHITSYTHKRATPGVEIQATIISNLLQGAFIQPLPAAAVFALLLTHGYRAIPFAIDDQPALLTVVAKVRGNACGDGKLWRRELLKQQLRRVIQRSRPGG